MFKKLWGGGSSQPPLRTGRVNSFVNRLGLEVRDIWRLLDKHAVCNLLIACIALICIVSAE